VPQHYKRIWVVSLQFIYKSIKLGRSNSFNCLGHFKHVYDDDVLQEFSSYRSSYFVQVK